MPAQTTGTLTTTGSVTLTKPDTDTMVSAQVSGTYGTVSLVFEGSYDGTVFVPLVAVREGTGLVVTGTLSPSDNSSEAWRVVSEGMVKVRLRTTNVGSGTLAVLLQSNSYLGLPFTTGTGTGSAATAFSSITSTGGITTSGATGTGLGYATGAGGTVTQATDRSTGVTLSKLCGQITTNNASLAAGAEASFTVTNTTVASTDTIVLSITPGGTGTPFAYVSTVGSGSFQITLTNLHASTADTSADVINFAVLKAVSS